jgi:hypothetical protein
MQNAPSLTAKTVALLRAAHQLMEGGTIYPDPLAVSILGEDVDVISGFVREHPEFDRLRLFAVPQLPTMPRIDHPMRKRCQGADHDPVGSSAQMWI